MNISTLVIAMLALCSAAAANRSFFRYLDLTPAMDLLPRAEIDSFTAENIVCFQLTANGDTLDIVKLDRGEPVSVYNFPAGFSVVTGDSLVTWTGRLDHSSGYRIALNEQGLPVLLSSLSGNPFMEWAWKNDSTVTAFSLDSLGNREDIDLLPNHTGSAIRLDHNGDLVYFKYGNVSAFAWQYTLNEQHRVVCRCAVDVVGENVSTADGIAETRYYYDSTGNLSSTRLFDINGNLMPDSYEIAVTGNYEFDSNGVVVNEVRFAFTERLYDENSLYIVERHYGIDGNAIENSSGVASTIYKRDVFGGISESVWLDIFGNRKEVEGISVTRRLFNEQGRVIESSTYNADLEVADFTGGFAYTRFSYAEDGEPELISYYDSGGLPVVNSSLGCHARSFVYNSHGACVELRYLDTAYDLINLATGYARVVSVFDQNGDLVEHLFYDQNGVEVIQ